MTKLKTFALALALGIMSPVSAEDSTADGMKAVPGSATVDPAANRKTYDALYSDIIEALPLDGKVKVDSARVQSGPGKVKPADPQEKSAKSMEEKRNRALEELPPAVKARVDKVISDLDTRRREKDSEFKELKK